MKRVWPQRRYAAVAAAVVVTAGTCGVVGVHLLNQLPSARVAASAGPRSAVPLDVVEVVYDGKLSPGWDDWGWGPHALGTGPAKVVFENFGGILLHHAQLAPHYGGVAFKFKAPEAWGNFMTVSLRAAGVNDVNFPTVAVETRHIAVLPDGYREVLVDLDDLNPNALPFDRIMIGSRNQVGSDWVLLDRIVLTRPSARKRAATPSQQTLRVRCDAASHAISEQIYGAASVSPTNGATVQRLGGNPLSRFNWELGAWNLGSDWYFENSKQDTMFQRLAALPEKQRLALVVPTIGWVAKDDSSVGFPRARFNAQRSFDPHRPEAGDGHDPGGKPIEPGRPEQTSVAAPPEVIEGWVRRLAEEDGKRSARSVALYILDNEPSLWDVTHRDVRPKPLTYDELLERTLNYSAAIRRADPAAIIAGPAEWGWLAYHHSAADRAAGYEAAPDRKAHDGVPLVPWYLRKLAEHERKTGARAVDMLDLHFYPAADRVFGPGAATDAATSALRLRSTRALWDPSYRDESWINEPIMLIPRMKQWVKENYPGTKLAIGEWNFGAEDHISGALATAEALGRFGQQGLDAAFHWGDLKEDSPSFWAFRAFRNFDGKGSRFQDVSMAVDEGASVSLFASRDLASKRVVLVLVNRSPDVKVQAAIDLQGCGRVTASRLFSYEEGANGLRDRSAPESSAVRRAELTTTAEPLSVELAVFSITVLDLAVGTN